MVCFDCIPTETRARVKMALESQVTWQIPMGGKKPESFTGNRKTPKIS